MVNNSLMPRPHPCREEKGSGYNTTSHPTPEVCNRIPFFMWPCTYICILSVPRGTTQCMELITLTVLWLVISHARWLHHTGSGRMSYCNQTLFLSGRVGSGHKTRSMQTAVERGWEGSCKAKNKYATFFLGTLYWQISHDNILGVFPFDFAETSKAWEQRYFLLLSQGKMTHLMQQKVIPMVLS